LGTAGTFDVVAIGSASTTYVIGTKVDVVVEFTAGGANGVDWLEVGSLIEICADQATFGSNIDGMGWGDPPVTNADCYDH